MSLCVDTRIQRSSGKRQSGQRLSAVCIVQMSSSRLDKGIQSLSVNWQSGMSLTGRTAASLQTVQ